MLIANKHCILIDETWYMVYEWIERKGTYYYGLRLRYKDKGTAFKYINSKSTPYASENEMKAAIKTEVSKWALEIQKQYNVSTIPIGKIQEIVHKQLKLF